MLGMNRGIAVLLLAPALLAGQRRDVNYDESKVPKFTLPDPLVCEDGTPVRDPKTWREK
ncbi:MAG TPA: acetylxylan esterase, partial [Bryobacterales bacterium]|nr:acetylxylan esterase [Bryobacterales bacterium]